METRFSSKSHKELKNRILNSYLPFISQLSTISVSLAKTERITMKQATATKKRKDLENKTALALENYVRSLPVELRKILVDDLVTAFESRLFVLNQAQSNSSHLKYQRGSSN
jgi:hypothetical protein